MRTFIYYTDPGHGWIKVPKVLLETLGIAKDITSFSYVRGEFAYLEEDCDFSKFADTYGIDKIRVVNRRTNRSSKIRSYSPYK